MLDTNICIYLINHQPLEVIERFSQYRKGEVIISSITWGELCCGINKHGKAIIANLLELLNVAAFDAKAADLSIKHPNRKANFDRLIAAHAIARNVPLVTNNPADFLIYEGSGLVIENWAK